NIPVGLLAMFIIGSAFQGSTARKRRKIDYFGTIALSVCLSAIVLATSLGGTTFPWRSPEILGFVALAIVGLAAFVMIEQRVEEPVMPLRLFRNQVVNVSGGLSFIIGMMMFGPVTFMPM